MQSLADAATRANGSRAPPSGLLEREDELDRLERLVDGALAGAGAAGLVVGEAGIGKTQLVEFARRLAAGAGARVLAARGAPLERDYAYGIARQLFEPVLAELGPSERASLLSGAAALAGPVFAASPTGPDDGDGGAFAMQHGLYWLTANLAQASPLLLAVDDLHWADAATLRWLDYLSRRLEGLPIALLAALRPPEESDHPDLVRQLLTASGAAVLRPGPLGLGSVEAMSREVLAAEPDDTFATACLEATRGNPLYLRALLDTLAAEGVRPGADAAARVFAVGPEAVARSVERRLARLPPASSAVARATAVLGDGCRLPDVARLTGIDLETVAAAAARLAAVGILAPGPALAYSHPVVRASVYDHLDVAERNRAHRAAAVLLAGAGVDPEAPAAHVLVLPAVGDPFAVRVLEEAARSALARGAPETAVAYLRRALDEDPASPDRGPLLTELGRAELQTDVASAVEHLGEAAGESSPPDVRLEALRGYGRGLVLLNRLGDAADAFATASALAAPGSDVETLCEAMFIQAALFDPGIFPRGAERARARLGERRGDGVGEYALSAVLAYFEARRGESLQTSLALARHALASGSLSTVRENILALFAIFSLILAGEVETAQHAFDATIRAARERGDPVSVSALVLFRGFLFSQTGDLLRAEAELRSLDATALAALPTLELYHRGFLGSVLMDRGEADEAEMLLGGARTGAEPASPGHSVFLALAQARLLSSHRRHDEAVETLTSVGSELAALGTANPAFLPWRGELARALAALGRTAESRRRATEELELARIWGAPRAVGSALRALAEVSARPKREPLLREAVGVLERSPARLEQARALVELGACLRVEGRRAEARALLRSARDLAEQTGSGPLERVAEAELAAAGARRARARPRRGEALTAAERRIAALAAESLTDREIAEALFLTVRTVELTLGEALRKLGVASRSELARALGRTAQTLSDIVRQIAPGRSWSSLMEWPPDVFAVTSRVLADSGAYRLVVSPPPGRHWPDGSGAPGSSASRSDDMRRWGSDWADWAAAVARGARRARPAPVARACALVKEASELPTSALEEPEQWPTLVALLDLHAMADEACSDLFRGARAGSAYHRSAVHLLRRCGSLSNLPGNRVRVLPKLRIPETGITVRSLSRHVAVDSSEVQTRWLIPRRSASRTGTGRLTFLLVPHPHAVDAADFRPVTGPLDDMEALGYGFFEFEPRERLDAGSVVALVHAARGNVGPIDAVVLPEAALASDEVAPLQRTLAENGVPLLVAGVRRRPSAEGLGASHAHIGGGAPASQWSAPPQYKHHRWRVERTQIEQYGLASSLDPGRRWWEAIDVGKRTLTFVTVQDDITLCPLVCEDLARPDPVTDVLREVGPTLVVALLLDGPQLASRWPGRYATVLADDPGCSVLTVTSLGMAERCRPPGCDASRAVALWRDAEGGLQELELAEGAGAIAVITSTTTRLGTTADGRRGSVPTHDLVFREAVQIAVDRVSDTG